MIRVLVVEDEAHLAEGLRFNLEAEGYQVQVAETGEAAQEMLTGSPAFDVVVLDVMLPGKSGFTVMSEMRQAGQFVPTLMLTARGHPDDVLKGFAAGADDYLTKPFDQHELKVRLRAGTRIIDLQRELVSAREALREQATKDFLTRIWNRSSILDIFQRELSRGARENRPVGLVLADLDHFKAVNDTYGHFAGDAVLREFARRMQSATRPYDAVGRYGGEEFLIILPGCDPACTANQAERMRAALANEAMSINDRPHLVTCSFGSTCWRPGMDPSTDSLIRVADNALYMAKGQGRDRVVSLP